MDYQTGKSILGLLREMCETYQMTVIVITHNSALAPLADLFLHLRTGKVYGVALNENPTQLDELDC